MMIANDYNRNIYIHINLLDSIYRIYICILIDHSYVPITWLWSILLLHGQ